MQKQLEQGARHILQKLAEHGYLAYMVGGYVRDTVMGRPIKDIDIATSALPEQVQALFERTVPTGLQHGTVTVMIGKTPYEVTTFRKEADYIEFRRPAEVEFVGDLQEDLLRRDFTMNAMAMDADGGLTDPFGGRRDIAQKLLRCVGEPKERFGEDALRMLRCLRFAAEYELAVEPRTWQALLELAPLLGHIALERVRAELERMIEGAHPNRALLLLAESGVLRQLKADVGMPLEAEAVKRWKPLHVLVNPLQRWGYLFIALAAEAEAVKESLRTLTFAKTKLEQIAQRVAADRKMQEAVRSAGGALNALGDLWKRTTLQYGISCMEDLAAIYRLDPGVGLELPDDVIVQAREAFAAGGAAWIEEMPTVRMSDLAITGTELTQHLQQRPGPWVGELLHRLLTLTATGALANDKQVLLDKAYTLCKENVDEPKRSPNSYE
ncbi:CCA tRNA nucleotidyltransferase [Paenibacillus hamazuiensis]|uniref:CCA tRNA nucleotidyltransferase n=1 Tax=Paenibacillus hamazuiensis TaxID=2936508 RepID=UPI00200D3FBE|nr:CCA tRNA nucleotidyltransferase [Paenibacillus hamazuiensis]